MKKTKFRATKHRKQLIYFVTLIILLTSAIPVFAWFDNVDQTNFLKLHREYLSYADGPLSIFGNTVLWWLIKGAYWICKSIEGLVPETMSLFNFVDSAKISEVYRSVVNSVVITLMILSLVVVGFKMITNKNSFDLKSIGLNIVMSVILIGLMPTLITSGVIFAKTFYGDATRLSASSNNVSWGLIEDGVTDLVLINKNNSYDQLKKENLKRNTLNKEYFFVTNFSEVLTSNMITQMKKDNPEADNFNYQLTINATGEPEAVKISDGFLAIFSDSFKSGYFRYKVNFFSVTIALLALSVAYLFSMFVIVTSIIELAFKKIVGVLVFATDIETGQKSKMVLSDILQCYLTVGFQGLGLSFFSFFISFISNGGGSSLNPLIKVIAYVCAVFALIKGSSTIMRYFGVDIGVREGFGQLSSTLALGSMAFRNKGKGNPSKSEKTIKDSQPDKNFGESIQNRANKATQGLSYAKERGFKGLTKDGIESIGNQVKKPIEAFKASGDSLKSSMNAGTADAIRKNMTKPTEIKPSNNSENKENLAEIRLPHKIAPKNIGSTTKGDDEQKQSESMRNQDSVNNQMKQDLKQRIIKDSASETDKKREAFVRERMEKATATIPKTRSEMLKQHSEISGGNTIELAKQANKNRSDHIDSKENNSDGTRNITVKENNQSNDRKIQTQLVNVKEERSNQNSHSKQQVIYGRLKTEGSDSVTLKGTKVINEVDSNISKKANDDVKKVQVIEEQKSIIHVNSENRNIGKVPANNLENNPLFSKRKNKNPFFDD